jgi:uncharacterized protein with HEPN domain
MSGRTLIAIWWSCELSRTPATVGYSSGHRRDRSHLQRGTLADGLVFDAVRIRLLKIGEAVKALPSELLDTQPGIPWRQIAGMRDHLAHRYFDTAHAILQATIDDDLPELERALRSLFSLVDEDASESD